MCVPQPMEQTFLFMILCHRQLICRSILSPILFSLYMLPLILFVSLRLLPTIMQTTPSFMYHLNATTLKPWILYTVSLLLSKIGCH